MRACFILFAVLCVRIEDPFVGGPKLQLPRVLCIRDASHLAALDSSSGPGARTGDGQGAQTKKSGDG